MLKLSCPKYQFEERMDLLNTKIFWECKIKGFGSVSSDNLGQRVVDKLRKLSKMDFSMECFNDDF